MPDSPGDNARNESLPPGVAAIVCWWLPRRNVSRAGFAIITLRLVTAHRPQHARRSDDRIIATTVWVDEFRAALRGERNSDVPCGSCSSCCTSSQFILIEADEVATLRHVPTELRFPAPRRPGSFVLGYDEHGRCPMLIDGACSIYAHRPRTCRTYDCRVFAATGLADNVDDKAGISAAAQSWRFDPIVNEQLEAMRFAATYLREHRDELGDLLPATTTHLAVLAFSLHDLFLPGTPELRDVRERIEDFARR
jgi:uncharacterized protein